MYDGMATGMAGPECVVTSDRLSRVITYLHVPIVSVPLALPTPIPQDWTLMISEGYA
jgi:hypothetical protein